MTLRRAMMMVAKAATVECVARRQTHKYILRLEKRHQWRFSTSTVDWVVLVLGRC